MNTHPSWKKKLCILCLCIALLCAGGSQTAQTASSSIGESAVSESTTQSRETYTYSDYELGRLNIPISSLQTLALFFHTSVDYLLGLTDVREPYPRK